MRQTNLRNLKIAGAVLYLSVLVPGLAAQPVIDTVTSVDVTAQQVGQGIGAIAQNGWGQALGDNIGSGHEPPTKVFLNGAEVLSVTPSGGWLVFHVPPETPLGEATLSVEIDGLMSAPVNFTISEYAPTGYRESNEDYHLDGYRVTEQNPALPGETLLYTGLTGLGAAPNPEVTLTLGGLPAEIVALDEVYMDARSSGSDGHYIFEEVDLPGIYTMQWIVPLGIEPGWQSGVLTVEGVTFTPPDNIGSQTYIGGGGGGGGEGTPSITEGGIVLASLLPTVNTVSPLSIISIFGEEFSTETILFPNLDENGNLDTNLGGFCAEIGGERSSIFAITPTQANIQTPGTPTLGPVDVVAIRNCDTPEEVRSSVAMVTVEEATPGFFLFPPLAEDGFIAARFNATPEQTAAAVAPEGMFPDDPLGPSRPAMPGEIILLFGTGWGPTTAGLAVGELAPGAAQVLPEANPTVMFAGVPLAPENVFYVGVTPNTAGLFQLAIRIPEGTPPGNHQVVLTVYGKSTPIGPVVPVKAP